MKTQIDTWNEDDYTLVLLQAGTDDLAEFTLVLRRPNLPDRDVSGDTDAYARRIKELVQQQRNLQTLITGDADAACQKAS